SFTEVTDGSGRPATYDVRYVAGSTLTWGASVPSVSRGTCAAPVAGTAIGAWRTCTVAGLTVGTTYSFELVAYRGTLKMDAVFGVKRTCTMLGVTRASAYTFQLVAFRGTLNVNAVFGGLSNIASGTTTGTTGGSGGGGGGGVSGGTVLLQENFADAAFAARGW